MEEACVGEGVISAGILRGSAPRNIRNENSLHLVRFNIIEL